MKHYIDSEKGVSARARGKSSANSQHLFHQDFLGIKVDDFIRIISEKSCLKLEKIPVIQKELLTKCCILEINHTSGLSPMSQSESSLLMWWRVESVNEVYVVSLLGEFEGKDMAVFIK